MSSFRKTISDSEVQKYWEIFSAHCTNPPAGAGPAKIVGSQAAQILGNSGLSELQLSQIWDLADIDQDGDLDFEEFVVAMRLIYDIMNGELKSVPKKLPQFMIPESKAHRLTAESALQAGGESFERPEDDDNEPGLKDGFDWYMKPDEKRKYEDIYTANAGAHGQIGFAALNELYSTINVPDTDITKAWTLVNPSRAPTIGKDQAIVFLHILAARHDGYRLPRVVPPSLRSSFQNSQINYDVESVQPPQRRNAPDTSTYSGKKAAFGESYLTRLGVGGASEFNHSGTDFGATKDEDWEEVRLKRQLADLEAKIAQAEKSADERRKGARQGSQAALTKRELEQMLDYKRRVLRELDEGGEGTQSGKNLKAAREDLSMVKEQVDALEQHLRDREDVLKTLLAEVDEERARR